MAADRSPRPACSRAEHAALSAVPAQPKAERGAPPTERTALQQRERAVRPTRRCCRRVAARRERPLLRGRAARRFDLRHRHARALRRGRRFARADRNFEAPFAPVATRVTGVMPQPPTALRGEARNRAGEHARGERRARLFLDLILESPASRRRLRSRAGRRFESVTAHHLIKRLTLRWRSRTKMARCPPSLLLGS